MTENFNLIKFEELGPKILRFPGAVNNHRAYINAIEELASWEDNPGILDDFGATRRETTLKISASDNILWQNLLQIINDCINTYTLHVHGRHSIHNLCPIPWNMGDVIHVSKYRVGGGVHAHTDNNVVEDNGQVSCIWYINDSYEGGELGFSELNKELKPGGGDIFIFPCNTVHYAKDVEKGVKYISIRQSDY